MALMLAAAAIAAIGSLAGGIKAKRQAKRAGRYNAALIRAETAETVRRAQLQADEQLGGGIAATGGSGVRMQGTPQNYLQAMSDEQQRQIDWTQQAGEQRAQAALRGASQAGSSAMTQGVLGATSSVFNYLGTIQNNPMEQNLLGGGGVR